MSFHHIMTALSVKSSLSAQIQALAVGPDVVRAMRRSGLIRDREPGDEADVSDQIYRWRLARGFSPADARQRRPDEVMETIASE